MKRILINHNFKSGSCGTRLIINCLSLRSKCQFLIMLVSVFSNDLWCACVVVGACPGLIMHISFCVIISSKAISWISLRKRVCIQSTPTLDLSAGKVCQCALCAFIG